MDERVWLTDDMAAVIAPSISSPRPATPALALLLGSMLSVQIGGALSVGVFDEVGPSGTAWLRLCWAAAVLLLIIRPRRTSISTGQLRAAAKLGVASGVMTLAYFGSIARLPLGTASALEFLGPLSVAIAARTGGRSALAFPALAAGGVLALTEPWTGAVDPVGVALALVAAAGWGAYIVLTQRVADALPGLTGLALSFPVAALIATPFGIANAGSGLSWTAVAQAGGLALLLPLLPYVLELIALRRLTSAAFGIVMCIEPALGVVVGLVLLGQQPGLLAVLGVLMVVTAGVGANRTGTRSA